MSDETGYILFPGIEAVEGGSYTLTLGISPSVAVIACRPQKEPPAKYGTLTIGFGDDVPIRLYDCVLDSANMQVNDAGQTVTAYILDRRWKWRYPTISGIYNQYKPNGDLDTTTEKTPQELAKLCLDAIGEVGYDVSALPDDVRPEVNWDYANAAEALQQICDQLGCVIALGLDNKVRICKAGTGATLPDTPDIANYGYAIDPPDKPSSIRVIGEPNLYCMDFQLTPIAREVTGEIEKLSDVSYYVSDSSLHAWQDYTYFTGIADIKAREYAAESVGKYYGIAARWGGNTAATHAGYIQDFLNVSGCDVSLFSVEKQIEFFSMQLYDDAEGNPRPPTVYGQFITIKDELWKNNVTNAEYAAIGNYDESKATEPSIRYRNQAPFAFDIGGQFIRFGMQQRRFNETTGEAMFPHLTLRAAFRVKYFDGRYFRTDAEKTLRTDAKTKPLVIRAEGVVPRFIEKNCGPDGGTSNIDEVKKAFQEYADIAASAFAQVDSQAVTYERIRPIAVDGAIKSVSWQVGGGETAKTYAQRNSDIPRTMPTYRDRRFRQQTADVLKAFKQLNNQIKQANKRPKVV